MRPAQDWKSQLQNVKGERENLYHSVCYPVHYFLSEKGPLLKERICFQREQILSFRSGPFSEEGNTFDRVASVENLSICLKIQANS